MSDPTHEGDRTINVTTGAASQAAVAGGDQDNVTLTMISSAQQEEIEKLLTRLREAIEAHAGDLANPEAVRAQTTIVEQQLLGSRPDRGIVKGLLSGIADGARNVTAIVEVVTSLQHAIGALV